MNINIDRDRNRILSDYTEIHKIYTFVNKSIGKINSVYPWLLLEMELDAARTEGKRLVHNMQELLAADEDTEKLVALMGKNKHRIERLKTRIAEETRKFGSFDRFYLLLHQFVERVRKPMGRLQDNRWLNGDSSDESSGPTPTSPPTSERDDDEEESDNTSPTDDMNNVNNDDLPQRVTAGRKRPAPDDALGCTASKRRKGVVDLQVTKDAIAVEDLHGKFQNNKISEWPTGSGKWWLFECEEHTMLLDTIRGAGKHLAGPEHGLKSTFRVAAETLGIQVLRCTKSIADEHNARLNAARDSRNRNPPSRSNPKRAPVGISLLRDLRQDHPRHIPAPRRRQRAPEVDPTTIRSKQIYMVRGSIKVRGKKKIKMYPIIVLPFGMWERMGCLDDAPTYYGLLNKKRKLPECYLPRLPGEVPLWAPGYRDGEAKVSEREYPCLYFNDMRFPRQNQAWFIKARSFLNYDPNNPATLYVEMVEDFIRRRDIVTPPAELRRLRRIGELTPHPSDDEYDEDEEEEEVEEEGPAPEDPIDEDPGFALLSGVIQRASHEPTDDQQGEFSGPHDEQSEDDSYHSEIEDDSDDQSEDDSDDDDDDPASSSPSPQPDYPIFPNNGGSGNAAEEEEVDLYSYQGAGYPTEYDEVPANRPELQAHHENGEHRDDRDRLQHRDDFVFRFTQRSPRPPVPSPEGHNLMLPPPSRASECRSRSISQPRSRAVSSTRDTPTRSEDTIWFDNRSFEAINNSGSRQTSREPLTVGDVFREFANFRPRSVSSGA